MADVQLIEKVKIRNLTEITFNDYADNIQPLYTHNSSMTKHLSDDAFLYLVSGKPVISGSDEVLDKKIRIGDLIEYMWTHGSNVDMIGSRTSSVTGVASVFQGYRTIPDQTGVRYSPQVWMLDLARGNELISSIQGYKSTAIIDENGALNATDLVYEFNDRFTNFGYEPTVDAKILQTSSDLQEWGFVITKNDKGPFSNFGISLGVHRNYAGLTAYDELKEQSAGGLNPKMKQKTTVIDTNGITFKFDDLSINAEGTSYLGALNSLISPHIAAKIGTHSFNEFRVNGGLSTRYKNDSNLNSWFISNEGYANFKKLSFYADNDLEGDNPIAQIDKEGISIKQPGDGGVLVVFPWSTVLSKLMSN
jgi:hypothetical protein